MSQPDRRPAAMPIARLIALLNQLPQDYLVSGNAVGNLAVLAGDGSYTGFIDFTDAEIVTVTSPS